MTSSIQQRTINPSSAYAARHTIADEQAPTNDAQTAGRLVPRVGHGFIKAATFATTLAALPKPGEAYSWGGCYGDCYSSLSTNAKIGIVAGVGGVFVLAIAISCLRACCSGRSFRAARPDVEMGAQNGRAHRTGHPGQPTPQDDVVQGFPVSYEPQWSPPITVDGTPSYNHGHSCGGSHDAASYYHG